MQLSIISNIDEVLKNNTYLSRFLQCLDDIIRNFCAGHGVVHARVSLDAENANSGAPHGEDENGKNRVQTVNDEHRVGTRVVATWVSHTCGGAKHVGVAQNKHDISLEYLKKLKRKIARKSFVSMPSIMKRECVWLGVLLHGVKEVIVSLPCHGDDWRKSANEDEPDEGGHPHRLEVIFRLVKLVEEKSPDSIEI